MGRLIKCLKDSFEKGIWIRARGYCFSVQDGKITRDTYNIVWAVLKQLRKHDVVERTWIVELEDTGLKFGSINLHTCELENIIKLDEFFV